MYAVVAFNDVVGYVCSEVCGNAAVADITADHGDEADAGLDPVERVKEDAHCMGCGKQLVAS